MATSRVSPMLALAKEKMGGSGSTLSMRQNNRGASYFRLEGLPSPRAGPTSPPTQSSGVALSPHNIALQVTNSQLYQQLDDHKTWVWIQDEAEGYVVGSVSRQTGDSVDVVLLDGSTKTVDKSATEVVEFKRDHIRHVVDDLVRLEDMNIPTIMFNLKERAKSDLIYTNVGSILVSVNPYQLLPIYTPAVMELYRRGKSNLPPHPFNLADQCYKALFEENKNQSILVSGESGAGKTEAVKVVLQYLAEVAGSSTGVEQQILLANPILEAFGNAKTIRNNNSSRFGKWVEIHFESGRIVGARTINYLLEKTRVVQQAPNERNYHIFYQLVEYVNAPGQFNAELKATLGLGVAGDYNYLRSGNCLTIPSVDDVEEFKQTLKAMRQLKFDEVQVNVVFKLLGAILHLGNVEFEEVTEEKCRLAPASTAALTKAANLLALDPKELEKALTTRSIEIAKETTVIPLPQLKALESRDSLAKFLYGELFDWLVSRINEALAGPKTGRIQFIGVLDIFGFEIFEKNSFEQLCINFTNEKMQQMFNSSIFKEEEAIYKSEGINYSEVKFVDNQNVLDLIEKKGTGLLPIMDDELRMPKCTDKTYLDRIIAQHKDDGAFSKPVKIANSFTVQHYAGAVTYNVEGFLDKNRDQMFDDLVKVIHTTKIPLIKAIISSKTDSPASSKKQSRSLASQFIAQLRDLNDTITATTQHYIRCIKPNTEFKPCSTLFETQMSLRQLRYAGVFEAVSIRKNGFPYRLSYEEFVKRFYMISKEPLGAIHGIPRSEAQSKVSLIAQAMDNIHDKLHFGHSLVFYKADELKRLEEHRAIALKAKVVLVQSAWRASRARRMYAKLANIRYGLIAAIELRVIDQLEAALAESATVDWEMREAVQARVLLARLKLEHKLLSRITMMFSNPAQMGELTTQQEDKLKQFLQDAEEMEPTPFVHPKIDELKALLVRSGELREQRLKEEAERAAREEAERIARQTEVERLAEEERKRVEVEKAAIEESKKSLALKFHLNDWSGDKEANAKTTSALEVLFVSSPRTPGSAGGRTPRQRVDDAEAVALAQLPPPIFASPKVARAAPSAAPPQPVIPQDEQVKIDRIKNRLWQAISASPYSILDGVMFEADGSVTISIQAMTALKQAIVAAQAMKAFESPDEELRKAIYTAQMLMGIRMDLRNQEYESVRARLDGAQAAPSGFIEVPEISAARQFVSKNATFDLLEKAAAARDEPELRRLLAEAKQTGANVEAYETIHQALVSLLEFLESSLAALDYVKIQSAMQAIEHLGMPTYLVPHHGRCAAAIEVRKPQLHELIKKTIREMPDRAEMEDIRVQATVLNLQSADIDKLVEFLALNDEKLCRLQLEAAKLMGNEERTLRLNIELKGHLLERFSKTLHYKDAPLLKTPAEFASGKVFGKDKVMEGLLSFTDKPIHAALTRDLDKKSEDQAVKLFRNVMGWMGDRTYSYPVTLVQEICNKVVLVPALRDEVFAQIIKQLTGNLSQDSMKRGWQLLLIMLMLVPPSPKFENYVGVWLLHHGQSYHIHELHETIFKGALPNPPTLPELIYILYHLPPTPGESYASAKSVTLEQAEKSGVDLSNPLETPAIDRFDKHATLRGHGDAIKKERRRISDMRPPRRK